MQKKHITYAQPKGAGADAFVPTPVYAASTSRMVYGTVSTSAATEHYLNEDTSVVRVTAKSNAVFMALSEGADKAPARAAATLTTDETEVADETEIVVGSITYRIVDTLAQAYDVKRDGTDADVTLANLEKAINGTGTPGTEYHADTVAHPDVVASINLLVLTIEAKQPGAAANTIALTSDDAHIVASHATLQSGADGNFDVYIPAGESAEVVLDETTEVISFIADAGSAAVVVVEI